MEVWFSGTFGQHRFEIKKEGKQRPLYTALVDQKLYPVKEDFEREILEPNKSVQCYRIDKGLFVFPWRWGQDNSVWPRFEPRVGDIELISLKIERGYELPRINGHATMMAEIKKRLLKDPKRFDRARLRTRQ